MNDGVLDHGPGNETSAALAQVAIHMDAGLMIPKADVSPNDGIDAGIGYIDAMLSLRIAGDVILNQNAVFVTGENAPGAAAIGGVILNNNALRISGSANRSNSGSRDAAAADRILNVKSVNRDVTAALQVNPIRGLIVPAIDDDARIGLKNDWISSRTALGKIPTQNEAVVRPRAHDGGITGDHQFGGSLNGQKGSRIRSGVAVV